LSLDDVFLIIRQAESLLANREYEVPSTQIMQLVNSSTCSSYDCEFVAFAQDLAVPLITADKQILQQFPSIAKPIETYESGE